VKTIQLRRLAEINPATPEFDRLDDEAEVTFAPLETVWADGDADFSRRRPKAAVSTGYTRFRNGDVLVPKVTPTFQAGRVAVANIDTLAGAGTTELHVVRARPEVDPRFLAYVCRSQRFLTEGVTAFQGVAGLQRVPDEFVRSFPVMGLPLAEQRRIADYLDCQSARAQCLIVARRRQFLLIDHRSMAEVYQTVRGENESAERRPSGLNWLGSVPKDWPLSPVSTQFEVMLGKMLNADRAQGGHLRPYLRNVNVQWDHIDTENLADMDFPPNERRRYELRSGDLLVCEGGEPGRAAIWDGQVKEIYYQKALHRVRPRGHSLPRWLYYCMRAATAQNVFSVEGNTTTIAHLTREQLKAHRFPFPHPESQKRLVRQLDETMDRAAALRRAMRAQVQWLVERQDSLITAAVTGQIDVTTARGVA
jgi:type I restriction enzyme S subunit